MSDTYIPRYKASSKNGQHRSVTRHWGGRIIIWRGGEVNIYQATLASYRRIRRWMVSQ